MKEKWYFHIQYLLNQKQLLSSRKPHESKTEAVSVDNPDKESSKALVSALLALGFTRMSGNRSVHYYVPCPVGTFSNSSSQGTEGCITCPPGILHLPVFCSLASDFLFLLL